jgi:hypothetical protein
MWTVFQATVPGEANGGREYRGEWQPAEALVERHPPGDLARDAHGEAPLAAALALRHAVVEVERRPGGAGGHLAEIERMGAPVVPHEREAAAVPRRRMHHAHCCGGRDRRIDGGAARREDGGPGVRCGAVLGRDGTALGARPGAGEQRRQDDEHGGASTRHEGRVARVSTWSCRLPASRRVL